MRFVAYSRHSVLRSLAFKPCFYYFLVVFAWYPQVSRLSSLKLLLSCFLWWLFKALQRTRGPQCFYRLGLGGAFFSDPFGVRCFRWLWRPSRSSIQIVGWPLFGSEFGVGNTHFLWKGRVAPAPVFFFLCVFLGRKKWDEHGTWQFLDVDSWENDISSKGWFDDCRDLMMMSVLPVVTIGWFGPCNLRSS